VKGWRKRLCLKKSNESSSRYTKPYSVPRGNNWTAASSSVHALVTKHQPQKQSVNYKSKCRYCSESHYSDQCPSFKYISERKGKLKNSCYRCLKEGHTSTECKSTKTCVYCGERNSHHRSLCPKKFQLKSTFTQLVSENDDVQTTNPQCDESQSLLSTNEIVLMQTAFSIVENPDTSACSNVRLLLDSGSQRTYITENLCKKLDLKTQGEDVLNLVTFGSTKPQHVKTKRTKIKLKLKDGSCVEITANVVPVISGELNRKPVSSLQKASVAQILQSVDLADSFPTKEEKSSIELLIGNYFYLDLVLGNRIELQPGLYLLSSKLGWILTGRTCDDDVSDSSVSMFVMIHGSLALTSSVSQSVDPEIKCKPDLEYFWKVESIGITDSDVKGDDVIAYESFKSTLKFENGRYWVQWP